MPLRNSAIWQGRWEALDGSISDLIQSLNIKRSDWEFSIHSALRCLQAFSEMQYDFFRDGFQNGNLIVTTDDRAEYAVRQTIDQISYDLSVLRKAIAQRQAGTSPRRVIETLKTADRLSYSALKPAIETGIINDMIVITYLQKSAYVRVVPYAPIALIGIPETCAGIFDSQGNPNSTNQVAQDFLAIAHEVGHHVYWHGKRNGVSMRSLLRSKLPSSPAWRQAWLEEIFADVYGAIVAGPVIALDFQDILSDNQNLLLDDGEHPIPAIRPYIYTDAMRRLPASNHSTLAALDERWEQILSDLTIDAKIRPAGVTELMTSTKVRMLLNKAVGQILGELADVVQYLSQPQNSNQRWHDQTITDPTIMYDGFYAKMLGPKPQTAPQAPPLNNPTRFEAKGQGTGIKAVTRTGDTVIWEVGKPLVSWFRILKDLSDNGQTLLPETWRTLLEGGGWAAGGPDNDPSPKID